MNAPFIQPITEALQPVPAVHSTIRLYRIVCDGEYAGRAWRSGDVIACRHTLDPRGPVVLEARGHGRPRFGTLRGAELLGDGGEACSPVRWRIAGEVVAVLRRGAAESGGSVVGESVAGIAGWRVIGLVDGAVGALVDGADVAPVVARDGARAGRPEPVPLRVVHPTSARVPGGHARARRSWTARAQLSLFAGSMAA